MRCATRVPEAYDMWATAMQKWIDRTAGSIETARQRGTAPVTLPATRNRDRAQPDERARDGRVVRRRPACLPAGHVVDTLVHVWITSIYGDTT